MAKRSATSLVVVLWVAFCVAEHKAEYGILKDVKAKAKSWGNWASDKFADELGRLRLQEVEAKKSQDVVETLEEPTSTATEAINSAGLGTSKYDLRKASRASAEAKEFGLDKAKDGYNEAKRRINLAKNEASLDEEDTDEGRDHDDQTHDLKSDEAEARYNEAKENEFADEKKTEGSKISYEVAKENVSQAAGNLGDTLRDASGEL